jgi:hypothetical protein
MYNQTSFSSVKTNRLNVPLLSEEQAIYGKAIRYIEQWLQENKVFCHEIYIDRETVNHEKHILRCTLRAVDRFADKVHIFSISFREVRMEMSYRGVSQKPDHYEPGDITIYRGSNSWQ